MTIFCTNSIRFTTPLGTGILSVTDTERILLDQVNSLDLHLPRLHHFSSIQDFSLSYLRVRSLVEPTTPPKAWPQTPLLNPPLALCTRPMLQPNCERSEPSACVTVLPHLKFVSCSRWQAAPAESAWLYPSHRGWASELGHCSPI